MKQELWPFGMLVVNFYELLTKVLGVLVRLKSYQVDLDRETAPLGSADKLNELFRIVYYPRRQYIQNVEAIDSVNDGGEFLGLACHPLLNVFSNLFKEQKYGAEKSWFVMHQL